MSGGSPASRTGFGPTGVGYFLPVKSCRGSNKLFSRPSDGLGTKHMQFLQSAIDVCKPYFSNYSKPRLQALHLFRQDPVPTILQLAV